MFYLFIAAAVAVGFSLVVVRRKRKAEAPAIR